MPTHAIKVYLRAIHKFFVDTVSHELGRGLDCGFDCGVGGVGDGSGNAVLVPADALVYDRVFEAVFVVVEAAAPQ